MDKEQLITFIEQNYEDGTKVTLVYNPEFDGPIKRYENDKTGFYKVLRYIVGTDPYIRKNE